MAYAYDPTATEAKWQKKWDEAKIHETDLKKAKNPYYSLVMFPYPSGDKLHVGHWYNFAPADSYARYMRMQGKDVFEPMGFDAFGLPAENYAIKTGVPPAESIAKNVETMVTQLKRIGTMYDWKKTLNTSDPSYYKWTQWLFLQMFKNKLAYKKLGNVNFCPKDQTVLANEQVWEGKCERCGTDVIQKPLDQWFWNIKKYSQKLLDGLQDLDWPEKTKIMQQNWIGKSEGAEVSFDIVDAFRGVIGPINWPNNDAPLAADLNRRLTDEWNGRIHSPVRTVHLTFTPHGRMDAFDTVANAQEILRILEETASRHSLVLHEVAAMPDHVHLLVSFAEGRHLERDIVKKLKGASAREFLKNADDIDGGHLWGQKFHFEEVLSQEQFKSVLQYVQKNPEKAGINSSDRLLSKLPETITVFTTRVDTLFSAAFVVLAPDHPLVLKITAKEQQKEVEKYRKEVEKKTEIQRTDLTKEKTGVFTGAFVTNPANGEKLQVWIADFVLAHYGHGAVFADAHDERDFVFAKKYKLPLRTTIRPADGSDDADIRALKICYSGDGILYDSGEFSGLPSAEARKKISVWLEKKGSGKPIANFRLRDWLVSRQRYWGAPIPIVYDPEGNPHPVPEEHLPWLLPTDVEFKPTGKSPLTESKEFIARTEKIFGKGWRPEFDTMDTFVCSSFYYLRYLMSENAPKKDTRHKTQDTSSDDFIDASLEKKWLPVSMYIGGPEHACMHLIYARFVMMALKDFGFVSHDEPFKKLVHQGLITNKGAKMSKSKGNVVSPDSFIDRHGSDVFRMYLMFMGPFTDGGDWSDTGIKGIDRFVQRVWNQFIEKKSDVKNQQSKDVTAALHRTIKRVTENIQALHFNTAISALMEFLNALEKETSVDLETAKTFALLIAPMAPHLADELWSQLGGPTSAKATGGKKGFVVEQAWPTFDASLTVSETMIIVVQVNGKIRGELTVPAGTSKEEILKQAKALENVQKHITGGIKKEIYVPGKLVSLVA